MLRITQSSNASGAANYFDSGLRGGDYYATKENSEGVWGGKGATRLGLEGEVIKDDFVKLCNNKKPDGTQLNPRHSSQRKVGWDFTFNANKSTSILYAITGDERIKHAFEQSVKETMRDIELEARTPAGQGKQRKLIKTGEMIYGKFTHMTTRPVDGIPCCHMHQHVFLLNSTWNESQKRFQAMEIRPIKKIAPLFEAKFHSRMADKMKGLGYGIEKTINAKGQLGWEVKGIERSTIEKFSRRTSLIEKIAEQQKEKHGHITAKQKAQLGALTREKKLVGKSYDKLREGWSAQLNKEEEEAILNAHRLGETDKKKNPLAATEVVQRSKAHFFQRKSAIQEYQLKTLALKFGYGEVTPEEVNTATEKAFFHRKEIGESIYLTTDEAVQEEQKILAFVRKGKGSHKPINPTYEIKNNLLNEGQRAAIHHVLSCQNQVTIISGGAGTGKTTILKEIKKGMKEGGKEIIAFAPSASASRETLRSEGFENADTVARLLVDAKLQEKTKDNVILIDESGLLGTQSMNKIFEIAQQQNARILLSGDIRQHTSVARGDAMKLIERDGGIKSARINTILRQRDNLAYKQAVSFAAKGDTDAALHQLDKMGWVKEIQQGRHRLVMLATDYTDAVKKGKSVLIVSPTHIEGQSVTDLLREKLKTEGVLEEKEQDVFQLKNCNWTEGQKKDTVHYNQKDKKLWIEFHQNGSGEFIRGDRFEVLKTERGELKVKNNKEERTIPLSHSKHFTVFEQKSLPLAKGDKIRMTKGGKTKEGTRLNNGNVFTVKGFTKRGDIKLHTGKTLDKTHGLLTHGYTTTSHSSQGKTYDTVLVAQSSQSLPATSRQQFYVSISRGREQCLIYTDNKKSLEQAVMKDNRRISAREITNIKKKRRSKEPDISPEKPTTNRSYGKSKTI